MPVARELASAAASVALTIGILAALTRPRNKLDKAAGDVVPKSKLKETRELSLKSLEFLAVSEDVGIRANATRLIVSRALDPHALQYILDECRLSSEEDDVPARRLKAVQALTYLASFDASRPALSRAEAFLILIEILRQLAGTPDKAYCSHLPSIVSEMCESVCKAILHLIIFDDDLKENFICLYSGVDTLGDIVVHGCWIKNRLLADRCRDAAVGIVHSVNNISSTHPTIRETDCLRWIYDHARLSIGRSSKLTKMCLQTMYRLSSSCEDGDNSEYLTPLVDDEFIYFLWIYLRDEGSENIFWATHILYEFTYKDIGRGMLRRIPNLVNIVIPLLRLEDFYLLTAVMRTLCMLAYNNVEFQLEILQNPLTMERVAHWFHSNNTDLQYSALLLLHNIVENAEESEHRLLINSGALGELLDIAMKEKQPSSSYAADVITMICTSVHEEELNDVWWSAMRCLLASRITYLNHSAAVSLQMITLGPPSISTTIVDNDTINDMLKLMLTTTSKNTADSSAAGILSVASKDPRFYERLGSVAILPSLDRFVQSTSSFLVELRSRLYPAAASSASAKQLQPSFDVQPEDHPIDDSLETRPSTPLNTPIESPTPTGKALETALNTLLSALKIINVFARHVVTQDILLSYDTDDLQLNSLVCCMLFCSALCSESAYSQACWTFYAAVDDADISFVKNHLLTEVTVARRDSVLVSEALKESASECAQLAIISLAAFSRIDTFRAALGWPFLTAYFRLLADDEELDALAVTGYTLMASKVPVQDVYRYPQMLKFALKSLLSGVADFPAQSLLESVATLVTCTPDLTIIGGYTVHNDAETFESVRFNSPARPGQRCCYELVLNSSGLVQVGWSTKQSDFDPEGGTGVGDDNYSYAYDGVRRKRWHGRMPSSHSRYGLRWKSECTITCYIDLVEGTIGFCQDGVNMGIAFTDIDTSKAWYPSLSLSSEQGCDVRLGDISRPLRFAPNDYVAVHSEAVHLPQPSVCIDPSILTSYFEVSLDITESNSIAIGFANEDMDCVFVVLAENACFIGEVARAESPLYTILNEAIYAVDQFVEDCQDAHLHDEVDLIDPDFGSEMTRLVYKPNIVPMSGTFGFAVTSTGNVNAIVSGEVVALCTASFAVPFARPVMFGGRNVIINFGDNPFVYLQDSTALRDAPNLTNSNM